jgi:hypothetical protein
LLQAPGVIVDTGDVDVVLQNLFLDGHDICVAINRHTGVIVPSEPSDDFDESRYKLALQTAGHEDFRIPLGRTDRRGPMRALARGDQQIRYLALSPLQTLCQSLRRAGHSRVLGRLSPA